MSLGVAFVACIALGSLPGCGRSQQHGKANTDSQSGGVATTAVSSPEESLVLSNIAFLSEIVMSLNSDANESSIQLQSMGGVDNRQTYGAAYDQTDFPGCSADPHKLGYLNLTPNLDNDSVVAWLEHEGFLNLVTVTISYPHAQFPGYGTANTFYCPVLTASLHEFVPGGDRVDIHHTVRFPFARRVFDRWTYENRYQAQTAAQGAVKVFAGTFSYHFESKLPGVSFSGPGAGTVKLFLNPDNGQWTIADYNLHDPTIMLETK